MEGNRDESLKCLNIAERCIKEGHFDKATKFLNKAERLYPTSQAKDLLEQLHNLRKTKINTGSDKESPSGSCRQRRGSFEWNAGDAHSRKEPFEKEYTDDQHESVNRIKKCKDFYEVLGVEKNAKEGDLKKAYRKLALQMHPDKNKAPGATEAFKAVGNAFAVLNDPVKRKKYDTFGPEDVQSSNPGSREYSHEFEGDITPEELFNMFFGGGYPSGHLNRQRGHHSHMHNRQQYRYTSRETNSSNEGGVTLLLQFTPIILLIVLSLISSLFMADPLYSLQRSDKYNLKRKTQNLHVPYFVKQDFSSNFAADVRQLERQVEEEHVSILRQNCWRERSYKENLLWRARNYANAEMYERAQQAETPSCDSLTKLYGG